MRRKEEDAQQLTEVFLSTSSWPGLLVNLIMIGGLAAIGEELIFRGIFQKILYRFLKSGWLAIWISALVFSAIHLQFYGFLPRFILGLVYGYLFFWSGTILLPVLADFVNNAVPTIGAYLNTIENSGINEETPVSTQLAGIILPAILVVLILSYFYNKRKMNLYG
jgi:membrane protease YdiL (CAAX protease family)